MNMITTDTQPDAGKIFIYGERLNFKNMKKFFDSVAFCPQHNPLWEEMSLYEHLEIYAAIKGIPKNKIRDECNE
jgi:ABC-type multidrug transport system ATPase subunit